MKRFLAVAAALLIVVSVFAGCTAKAPTPGDNTGKDNTVAAKAVKTGLGIELSTATSKSAGTEPGLAQTDATIAAVTVDEAGKIQKCVIDGARIAINFSATGKITTDKAAEIKSKNELAAAYGMAKASSVGKEWNEQAAAFAKYCEGKTIDQIKGIAVTAEGKATGADLTSSVTVSIKGFQSAVEKAVSTAKDVGTKSGDKLGLGVVTTIDRSTDAVAGTDGVAEAYSYYTASTFAADGKITGSVIDASQATVKFDTAGKITSDINAAVKTKDELGDAYGMKKASTIGKEWYEQAAAFAKYATGKTVADLKGIAVNEKGEATSADIVSSVTVSVTDFIKVYEKASANAK